MQLREGNSFLAGAFLYILKLLRLSAVPWLASRVDWGTATVLQMHSPPRAQGVEQRCWGVFLSQLDTCGKLHFASAYCKVSSGAHDFLLSEVAGEH